MEKRRFGSRPMRNSGATKRRWPIRCLTRCQVDELGIDMPNFDETINKINDVANELAMRLAQQSHD